MKVELKNIKRIAALSEETHCFDATIYIDGKKAGTVQNSGHGGPDSFSPRDLQKVLNDYAATLPPIDVSDMYDDGTVHTMPQDAETIVGQLMDKWLEDKENKRLCKNKTVYRLPGHVYKDGEYHISNSPYSVKAREFLDKKYGPGVFILNEQLTA